jgi:pyruvate dehydrogenase E2 component (dihydrolipoamide acetyltransferase)
MAEFVMPSLGAGMESGVLSAWKVKPGDAVERGDIVAEVETEKGIIEVEVFEDGVVAELLVEEGTKVPVGTPLAQIGTEGQAPAPQAPREAPAAAHPTPELRAGERAREAPAPAEAKRAVAAEERAVGERVAAERRPEAGAEAGTEAGTEGPRVGAAEAASDGRAATPEEWLEAAAAPPGAAHTTPGARQLARERGVEPGALAGTPHGVVTRGDVLDLPGGEGPAPVERRGPAPAAPGTGERRAPAPPGAGRAAQPAPPAPRGRRVSPLARRRARELGVDLAGVEPGADGAVHAAQVEAASAAAPEPRAPAKPADAQVEAASAAAPEPRAPAKPADAQAAMRRAIAAAMSRSKREIPHYYLAHTIDFGPAMDWLRAENERRPVPERLLYGVLLLKAVAKALREVPELNAHWTGESAPPLDRVHLGVAVSLRKGGLIAPAIHDADDKDLGELMAAFKDLVKRTRAGQIRGSELTDATVTVTSLGERGVETVYPIINPPQVAMVGFGKVVERPWVVDGEVRPRPTVTATLAADHRVSDGHRGGLFLAAVERLLQSPEDL